ncbi:MAG: site-2 protease family protein [Spirochaetales bacterium]
MKMQTWWSIDFEGDTYELRSNAIGKEELLCNGRAIGGRFNPTSKGKYKIETRTHGECELTFKLNVSSSGAAYSIAISSGTSVLAEFDESIEEHLPSWLQSEEDTSTENQSDRRDWKTLGAGVARLAVAMVIWGLLYSWTTAPILIGVLLFHEAGHYLVMLIAGYQNKRLVVVPPFGMAVSGEKADSSDWERFLLFMAGPLPGIALALALTAIFGMPETGTIFGEIVIMLFVINYFNLLPVEPLDGGKIVATMFFKEHPIAQIVVNAAGAVGLGALSVALRDPLLGVLVVVMLILVIANIKDLRNPAGRQADHDMVEGEAQTEADARWYHRITAGFLYLGTWAIAIVALLTR